MSLVIREQDGGVLKLTINRPDKLNALNRATLGELDQCVTDAERDDSVRAVVITGAGDKAFVAGADISELTSLSPLQAQAFAADGQGVFRRIETLGKPVVAAINGFALGGGCELAMACTLRLCARTAKLGLPEVSLGLIPGFGGTQRLPRLVGPARAAELMLTGQPIDAETALNIGLVNRVVDAAELDTVTMELAHSLAERAPIAVEAILRALALGSDLDLDRATQIEAQLFGLCSTSEDMREGTRAFLEKRQAVFRGK